MIVMLVILQSQGITALIGLGILAFLLLVFMVGWFVVRYRNFKSDEDEEE